MVTHDVVAQGVDFAGHVSAAPVLLQLNVEDFPARFLQDLATRRTPAISSAAVVDPAAQPLYQPVQRVLHIAMAQLTCHSPGTPRVDPARVRSAGVVIRRVGRAPRVAGREREHRHDVLQGWMRSPAGRFSWVTLDAASEKLDPDPARRPGLYSGRAELDAQLAAIAAASANAEVSSPAFLAPPATCARLGETIAYGIVPTASSDVADGAAPPAPSFTASDLASNLPVLLQRGAHGAPLPGRTIDYRWMSDDFLSAQFPPSSPGRPDARIAQFGVFATALRMLASSFGAFDDTAEARAIMRVLDGLHVYTSADRQSSQTMGSFYRHAAAALLDYAPASGSGAPPTVVLPYAWDALSDADASALANALFAALAPSTRAMVAPQGRFQDATRLYRLRMFFRVASEDAACPPVLIWTQYSAPFRIAAWYESGPGRAHAPVPLPDPTDRNFLKNLAPNCSFVVPAKLMGAMQGTSMSGLMNGSGGGGPSLSLNWICGFNIPLITICAFFVLNIFLSLLNIVFFWLPMIKICIPFPEPEE